MSLFVPHPGSALTAYLENLGSTAVVKPAPFNAHSPKRLSSTNCIRNAQAPTERNCSSPNARISHRLNTSDTILFVMLYNMERRRSGLLSLLSSLRKDLLAHGQFSEQCPTPAIRFPPLGFASAHLGFEFVSRGLGNLRRFSNRLPWHEALRRAC